MFIEALSKIAQKWEQFKYPPTVEYTKCGVSISWNVEQLYKKNGILIHVTTWTNLENILLCERSQI